MWTGAVAQGSHVTVIKPRETNPAKLRVAAYCRVSSDSADQLNSYIAQVEHYTKYISSHEGWELADIYADEGLTGMEVNHREEFKRMIADCRDGKIDLVTTKSVTRFARNTLEGKSNPLSKGRLTALSSCIIFAGE